MDSQQTTCRIQVQCKSGETSSDYVTQSLKDVKGAPDMTEKLKLQWVKGIVEAFSSSPSKVVSIRPFDILLHQDGSVEGLSLGTESQGSYPSRFRVPPFKLHGLDEGEKVKRVEKFALGSLLYEVITTNEPFEQLSDDEVQDHYSRGAFPDDVFSMAMGPYILGCWSHQFEKEMEKLLAESSQVSMGDRFRAYAKAHPYLLAAQIAGGVATTASLVALPVLGAAGFGTLGPVAGSAAGAWQASQGLVQAGSVFAWCQSAAMGGAAVNGIIGFGAAGGSVALAATGAGVAGGQKVLTPEKMKEMFLMAYRKENSGTELIWEAEKSRI